MANYPLTELETKAWIISKELHKDQVRKFVNKPYFDAHVAKVNGILKLSTKDEEILVVSILHDIIEDCFMSKEDGYNFIKREFGQRIAKMVMELTSDKLIIKSLFDGSKKHYLLDKMLRMSNKVFTVKLADRLQNIEDIFLSSENFRKKYVDETLFILDNLKGKRPFNKIQKSLYDQIYQKCLNSEKLLNNLV